MAALDPIAEALSFRLQSVDVISPLESVKGIIVLNLART